MQVAQSWQSVKLFPLGFGGSNPSIPTKLTGNARVVKVAGLGSQCGLQEVVHHGFEPHFPD